MAIPAIGFKGTTLDSKAEEEPDERDHREDDKWDCFAFWLNAHCEGE